MKPISIACGVAVIIACVCVFQSAGVPLSESQVHLEEPMEETEAVQSLDQGEASSLARETSPEVLFRTKRQSHLSLCRYCCNCLRTDTIALGLHFHNLCYVMLRMDSASLGTDESAMIDVFSLYQPAQRVLAAWAPLD
ncbi:hepcidin-1 precursor isoform 2 precursor [Silurus asotus]|uniref:Hepcidin-1 isoform 2 n=1 Tax=Silurus asotus TaxID=30991 RepID=A0AAD5A9Y6_SILAS|nr:hepcidin-1 precursor isoform 2 precursor [Silurus asotus]